MNTETATVYAAMSRSGGTFCRALAECIKCADPANLAKIKKAFPFYWLRYSRGGKATPAANAKVARNEYDSVQMP